MTPTPRTDAAIIAADGRWTYELKEEMKRMERELAAAKERIRRLEVAGNEMAGYLGDGYHVAQLWIKAVESKP